MSRPLRGTLSQRDFSGGMVRDVAPELIAENAVYDLENALLDEDGDPYRRGGTTYKSQPPGLFTVAVADAFNRANENPVAGSWAETLLPFTTHMKVTGEKLAASAANSSAVYNATVTDGIAYATASVLDSFRMDLYIRTAGEGSTSTFTGYNLDIELLSGIRYWRLYRNDAGHIGSTPISPSIAQSVEAGDKFALTAVGDVLTGWHQHGEGEWMPVVTATDSTYASGRGAIAAFSTATRYDDFGFGEVPAGFSSSGLNWIWDGYLGSNQRTICADSSNFAVLGSDDKSLVNIGGAGLNVPKQSAVLKDMLFIGGGSIYGGSRKATYSTGTLKVNNGSAVITGVGTEFLANVDAGMLMHIGSERVYAVDSVQGNTELTLRDKYEGATGEGKAYSLVPLYAIGSDPYETWDYLTVCANRLVVLNGSTVKVTEIDNPHTFVNSLGTTNEHSLPEGVQGLGLATVGQTVLIFTTAGIWTLDGLALDIVDQNGNPQHRLQELSSEIVLAGASGIAGSSQQIVVPAVDGVYLMDGISQPVRISRPIDRLYREQIDAGYRLGRAVTYRGHYFLPIITSSGAVRQLLVCRLDTPTRSRGRTVFPWSRFTGDGGEITAYAVRSPLTSSEPLLLGAQSRTPSQIEDCSAYFLPDEDHESDADGTTHVFDVTFRDFETGGPTVNSVRAFKPRYELRGKGSPKIQGFYSDGAAKSSGAKWGQVKWGEFKWAGPGGSTSFTQAGEAGESDAQTPARFRINKRLRYVRTRFKCTDPAAVCALRGVEITTRPSEAPRR